MHLEVHLISVSVWRARGGRRTLRGDAFYANSFGETIGRLYGRMGQQQLLLIVLAVIIVGLAIVIGIELFSRHHQKANTASDQKIMLEFAGRAQLWKQTPLLFGGGLSSDPADFSSFTVYSIGLKVFQISGESAIVQVPAVGCFSFISSVSGLSIYSLDEQCAIDSWDKRLMVSGVKKIDLVWIPPDAI
jgi:hypothetical protein